MPSIINATTSSGLVTSADNSGSLQLQTNSGTTAVTVDTSQRVLLGATSASGLDSGADDLVVGAGSGSIGLTIYSGSTGVGTINFADGNTGSAIYAGGINYNHSTDRMNFYTTDGTGRMSINSTGVGINSAPAGYIGNEQLIVVGINSAGQYVQTIAQNASSPSGACALFMTYSASAPNNTSNSFLICNDNTGVQKLNIYSNGTVSNRTGTYNSLSDVKLKENIVDATPKLDKLMQAKVRNYNLIGDDLKQIGFVAQELEQVFPSLVEDVPDYDENQQPTGEVTKMVKTSVLIPILVKAMQELKAELDATKAEVAALKGVA